MLLKRREKITRVVKGRQGNIVVVLEDITDPHNAAAVLRSCEAFGISEIYFIFERQPQFNPHRIGKASSASANKWLTFKIFKSTRECITALTKEKYQLFATVLDPKASSIYETDLTGKIALAFGNEHSGLSAEILSCAFTKLTIPMRGMVESLNISVCAGIFLYELTRQRLTKKKLTSLPKSKQEYLLKNFS